MKAKENSQTKNYIYMENRRNRLPWILPYIAIKKFGNH